MKTENWEKVLKTHFHRWYQKGPIFNFFKKLDIQTVDSNNPYIIQKLVLSKTKSISSVDVSIIWFSLDLLTPILSFNQEHTPLDLPNVSPSSTGSSTSKTRGTRTRRSIPLSSRTCNPRVQTRMYRTATSLLSTR